MTSSPDAVKRNLGTYFPDSTPFHPGYARFMDKVGSLASIARHMFRRGLIRRSTAGCWNIAAGAVGISIEHIYTAAELP